MRQLRALKVRDLFVIGCTATLTAVVDCNLAPYGFFGVGPDSS